MNEHSTENLPENTYLFDSYIKGALPNVGGEHVATEVPRRLMHGINAQDPVEQMISSLMVMAYSQSVKLVSRSNERPDPFSVPYEKANAEAMGYMRIFCQLAANLGKLRREKAQEHALQMRTNSEEHSLDSGDAAGA